MTFRIQTETGEAQTLSFSGLIDLEALGVLAERCKAGGCRRLELRPGTEALPECIAPLLELEREQGLELVVAAPYLAHWLEEARRQGGPRP